MTKQRLSILHITQKAPPLTAATSILLCLYKKNSSYEADNVCSRCPKEAVSSVTCPQQGSICYFDVFCHTHRQLKDYAIKLRRIKRIFSFFIPSTQGIIIIC